MQRLWISPQYLLKRIAPIIVGLIVILSLIYKIGISNVLYIIFTANVTYLILSSLLFIFAFLLKNFRWYLFLKPTGINDIRLSTYSYFVGQIINELLPTGSGEIFRIFMIKKEHNIRFTRLMPGILLERFYDIILLFILSIILASVYFNNLIIIMMVTIIIIFIIIFIKPYTLNIIAVYLDHIYIGHKLLINLIHFMSTQLREFSQAIDFYKNNKIIMIINILITIFAWVIFETFAQYLLLRGFSIDVPIIGLIGVISISYILGAISMIPGGLGVMEVVYALVLSNFGIPFEIGASIAIIYRTIICSLLIIMGSLSYLFNYNKNMQVYD